MEWIMTQSSLENIWRNLPPVDYILKNHGQIISFVGDTSLVSWLQELKATHNCRSFMKINKNVSWRKMWKMNAIRQIPGKHNKGRRFEFLLFTFESFLIFFFFFDFLISSARFWLFLQVSVNWWEKIFFPLRFECFFIDFCTEIANGAASNA